MSRADDIVIAYCATVDPDPMLSGERWPLKEGATLDRIIEFIQEQTGTLDSADISLEEWAIFAGSRNVPALKAEQAVTGHKQEVVARMAVRYAMRHHEIHEAATRLLITFKNRPALDTPNITT